MSNRCTDNLEALTKKPNPGTSSSLPTYEEINGVIIWNKSKDTQRPLCNFTARISAEEIHDDGAEKKTNFVIDGQSSDGRLFPTATVYSDKFSGMAWVNSNWGAKAIIYAGQQIKDHLRVAIQTNSGEVPQRTIYTHLGWREIGKDWVYLHAEGAIGKNESDVQVSLDGRLKFYAISMPPPHNDLKEDIKASLSLLELAPLKISAPLLAAIYRAPLGECCETDFSVFLSGQSGCQKSELTAMMQAHFGKDFKRTNLPGNWSSTANALERQSFLAKDAIFTVDDFAPTGSAADVARLHKEADRLLRAQGNRAGRDRLTSEAKGRPQYFPRGIIVSSGEDVPRGTSVRSRMCILEICSGDVELKKLTAIQQAAELGQLARSMSGYIKWLAPQIESLKSELPIWQRQIRAEINLGPSHARTPDLIINLSIGLEYFLKYAQQLGAIDQDTAKILWTKSWNAIQETGKSQADYQNMEDSTFKFFELLGAAIISGRAHLADAKTGAIPPDGKRWGWAPEGTAIREASGKVEIDRWRQKGDKIGWIDGNEVLLNSAAAYACAQDMARKQNDSIPTSANTLWKRLVQKGFATKGEPRKNTCKRTVEGKRQRVLVIPDKELLYGHRNGDNVDTGDTSNSIGPSSPQKVPLNFEESEKWGRKMEAEPCYSQGVAPAAPHAPISQMVNNHLL